MPKTVRRAPTLSVTLGAIALWLAVALPSALHASTASPAVATVASIGCAAVLLASVNRSARRRSHGGLLVLRTDTTDRAAAVRAAIEEARRRRRGM